MTTIALPRRVRHRVFALLEILALVLLVALLSRTLVGTLVRANQSAAERLAVVSAVDFPPSAGTLPATQVALVAQLDRAADF